MSVWTHVAGIIRVDSFREDSRPNWNKIMGRVVRYASSDRTLSELRNHPERFMPCGSEGSLERHIWTNPNKYCMDAYAVSIFGDLRDYSAVDKVIEWFKGVCKQLWVRQACITVKCENGTTKSYIYSKDNDSEENQPSP